MARATLANNYSARGTWQGAITRNVLRRSTVATVVQGAWRAARVFVTVPKCLTTARFCSRRCFLLYSPICSTDGICLLTDEIDTLHEAVRRTRAALRLPNGCFLWCCGPYPCGVGPCRPRVEYRAAQNDPREPMRDNSGTCRKGLVSER